MKEYIIKFLKDNLNIEEEIELTVPKNLENGDFTTNIAMKISKRDGKSKEEILNSLTEKLEKDGVIKKIVLAGPGFLNFYVSNEYLLDNVKEILSKKLMYGQFNNNNIKVDLEYVSANPTGILHLGHARGACYGDSLSRILKCAGYDVTREYYINDAGNQINNLGISIKERYKELCGLDIEFPEDGYHGPEIIEIANDIYKEYNNSVLEESIDYFKTYGIKKLLGIIITDLKNINIEFDIWSSEEELYKTKQVEQILSDLNKSTKTYEEEGAIWLKTSEYFDEKDRVLVKSDGTNTYLLPDIAYHQNKYKREYDVIIDVLGADHHGYINRIKSSMKILGHNPDKLEIKILQLVRLIENGSEVKMSKRTGKAVTINDLNEMVGKDALRYFYIMKSLDTQMDFDLNLAKSKSTENPVYYVQYAHARICSILKEADNKDIKIDDENDIFIDNTYEILKKLNEFKSTIEVSANKRLPHLITNYVYDLASLFHSYYSNNKVITEDKIKTINNLKIITAIKTVIAKSLDLVGVSSPEKM